MIEKNKRDRIASVCVCCNSGNIEKSSAILMPFVAHRVFDWKPTRIDDSWGLSTIENGNAYALCNSLLCNECGLIFLDIRFTDAELAKLYSGYRGEEYTSLRDFYEPGYKERNGCLVEQISYVSEIEKFLSPLLSFPIITLDWGGDVGLNSPFNSKGNKNFVYEISNKKPIDGVIKLSKVQLDNKYFDLVVCSNVLEHVPYPSDMLKDIAVIMSQDTILYLEVPFEGLMASELGRNEKLTKKKHWHEHINFFSELSLLNLIEISGFDLVKIAYLKTDRTDNLNVPNIIQIACKLHS